MCAVELLVANHPNSRLVAPADRTKYSASGSLSLSLSLSLCQCHMITFGVYEPVALLAGLFLAQESPVA